MARCAFDGLAAVRVELEALDKAICEEAESAQRLRHRIIAAAAETAQLEAEKAALIKDAAKAESSLNACENLLNAFDSRLREASGAEEAEKV